MGANSEPSQRGASEQTQVMTPCGQTPYGQTSQSPGSTTSKPAFSGVQQEVQITRYEWQYRGKLKLNTNKKVEIDEGSLDRGVLIVSGKKDDVHKECGEINRFSKTMKDLVVFTEIDVSHLSKKIDDVRKIVTDLERSKKYRDMPVWWIKAG